MNFCKAMLLVQLLGASISSAATYYMATNGSDAGTGAAGAPWATFDHAWTVMQGGDTLFVGDGTYKERLVSSYGSGLPSGSVDHYTLVKAEHSGSVVIDGSAITQWQTTMSISQASYIHIEGFIFKANHSSLNVSAGDVSASNHIKIVRCGFYDASETDNTSVTGCGSGSSYILWEECWAWGTGRYKFLMFGDENGATEKIILRRCVSRHDYHDPPNWGFQCATFTAYDCHDYLMQNCISINSGDKDPLKYGNLYGGLWIEHKQTTGQDNSARIQGSIFLDLGGLGAIHDPKSDGVRQVDNCVFWHSQGGYTGGQLNCTAADCVNPTLSLNHITAGDIWGEFGDESNGWGTGASATSGFTSATITNSSLSNCNSYGVANYLTSNYNNYFGNHANFGAQYGVPLPTAGAQDRFVNPARKYICRVEENSPLKGAASDGRDVGATITQRYGVSGTLWGEPGYDSLISEPLWPFPNEDIIKSTMGAWTYKNDGKRGFCADGNGLYGGPITLTSYIWEYLCSPCPPEICGNGASTRIDAPVTTSMGMSVRMNSSGMATISFVVRDLFRSAVHLSIYNASGRLVETLVDQKLSPGSHCVVWHPTGQPSGAYIVRLNAPGGVQQKKIMLVK